MEDYLRAIYRLSEQGESATTSAIAERLSVAPASVTKMIKRLASMELVAHEPYQGVTFTPQGRKAALEVVRHHRLIELFLYKVVGVPWDRVHDEAHRLEHALSEYLEDRIAELLGDPTLDPHGQPIPSRTGEVIQRELHRLSEVEVGTHGQIAQVEDNNPELLRYVAERGLLLGTSVVVEARDAFGGNLTLQVDDTQCILGSDAAQQIWISGSFEQVVSN